jgi:outer membrane protein TolC
VSEDLIIPEINQTIPEMEEQALLNRPELIEADYQKRISAAETKKAIARLLPGIELSVGDHYDSNKFLVNNQWSDGGVRVTWNLLNLLTGSGSVNAAKAQEDVAHSQRLALNMAVLSQVHIANRDFMGKKREFLLANELKEIDGSISRLTTEAMTSGADNRLQQIRAEVTALSADLRRWQAYAAMSTAYAQVQTSIGEDPLPESVASYQLKDIASAFALKMTTLLKQVSN